MFYTWLAIILFLGFIEIATTNLVTIWFVISGLISLFLSLVINNFVIQFVVFVVIGVLLMLATRTSLEKS